MKNERQIKIEDIEKDIEQYRDYLFDKLQQIIKIYGVDNFRRKYQVQQKTIGNILHRDEKINIMTLLSTYKKCFTK